MMQIFLANLACGVALTVATASFLLVQPPRRIAHYSAGFFDTLEAPQVVRERFEVVAVQVRAFIIFCRAIVLAPRELRASPL